MCRCPKHFSDCQKFGCLQKQSETIAVNVCAPNKLVIFHALLTASAPDYWLDFKVKFNPIWTGLFANLIRLEGGGGGQNHHSTARKVEGF